MTREEYTNKNIELNDKIRQANVECDDEIMLAHMHYNNKVETAARKHRTDVYLAKSKRAEKVARLQSELQRLKTEYMMQVDVRRIQDLYNSGESVR